MSAPKPRDSELRSPQTKNVAAENVRIGVQKWSFAPTMWVGLALVLVAFFVGWKWGWIEATALGVLGVILPLFSALLTTGRSTYRVELGLGETQVRVGDRAFGRLDIENVGRRRVLPSTLELPVGGGRAEFALSFLGPGRTHDELFSIPTKKRSVILVGPVMSVRTDPLGLVRREITWTKQEQLFVHPRTVHLMGAAAGVMRDLEGQTLKTVTDNDMNFHALREYVAGDDRRSIHWKSSARTQSLMVRQFEDTRRTHTALAIDVDQNHWTDEESFELGVSVFGSIGIDAIRSEMDRTFLVDDEHLRSTSPKAFLDETSAINIASSGDHTVSVAERIAREASDCSLAVMVTGAVPNVSTLREEATRLHSSVRVLYIQCAAGQPSSVMTFGQTSFATLGELDELPRVLRLAVGV